MSQGKKSRNKERIESNKAKSIYEKETEKLVESPIKRRQDEKENKD